MVCAAALLLCILLFPRFAAPLVMQHRSSPKDIPVELPSRASATRDSEVVAKSDSSPCPYPDQGLAYPARRTDDLLQRDSGWIALAQALDDTPGTKSHSRFEGGLDASTQRSADRKRRRLNPSDEEAFSLKSYECRFCPMKFDKSQALGGHMNRHRQERQHETLNNACHLVMQHRYPTLALPGQDQSSPSGLKSQQDQMQRLHAPAFEYDTNMAASGVSSYKSTQYSPHASLLVAPGSVWNLDVSIGSTQNAAAIDLNLNTLSLDATMKGLQKRLPSGTPLSMSLPFMMQQPPIRFSEPDMLEMPFERNTAGLAAFRFSALNSNPYAAQTSSLQTQRQYGSGGSDRHVNVSSVRIPSGISQQNLAPLASMQPEGFHMALHGGFHFSGPDMLEMPFERNTAGLAAFRSSALNSDPYVAQTSSLQNQRQYGSGGQDRHANVSSVRIPSGISQLNLAPLTSMQPEGFHMAPHGGFHFSAQNTGPVYSYPTEGIKASTSNPTAEFNAAFKNPLKGEPWIFAGNQKNANEEHNHALTSDAKVRHANVSSVRIPSGISQLNLAPLTSMQPEGFHTAPHGGFHFSAQNTGPVYSYSTEGIKASTSNATAEFNAAFKNPLEGEAWIFAGNQKNANEEHNHALTSDAKVTTTLYGQSRMMRSTASAMWSGANRSRRKNESFP